LSSLPPPPLTYLITTGELTPLNFAKQHQLVLDSIRNATNAGVSLIQIREKQLSGRLLFELTADASSITRGTGSLLLVNDRPDIALAADADGIHLPADSLPTDVVRRSFPAGFIIGVSTHTVDEVKTAARQGADLAVFGPVFESPGKQNALGVDALRDACEAVKPFPVLALGGIDATNWRTAVEAGAAGFAAIRSLNDCKSFKAIMTDLRSL
jgi:thiamine-phosphate pyrophosphorylase